MLLPILVAMGLGGGYVLHRRRNRGMTPARKKIFEEAMSNPPEPSGLRKLADAFDKAGCKDEATALRKRAILRELPPEQKAKRKAAFRDALKVQDPTKIPDLLKMAEAFEKQGATANAVAVRRHAAALQKVAQSQKTS